MKTDKTISLVIAVLTTLVALPVLAASGSTTKAVNQVEYRNGVGTDLILQTADVTAHQATVGLSPCASVFAPSIDTVKLWMSLGQAALLSGKNVQIYWNDCGGAFRWITDVILVR